MSNKNESRDGKLRLVCKANDLVEAKYRLTVQEQKIIVMAIAKINPTKDDFENPYSLSIDEIAKACDINRGGTYQKVAAAVDRLMTRLVKIKTEDGHVVTHWIQRAKYYTGQGHFDFWLDEEMKPYLLKLQEYVSYDQRKVLQFQSSYSFRIYEILKKWQGANKGNQFSVKVDQLRDVLGIRKTEYKLFGDFKRFVIIKAQTELTQQSDIAFTYNTWKEGRAVAGLVFTIKDNDPTGKPQKKKRGRPKKLDESIQPTSDLFQTLDDDGSYPLDLTKKLDAAGVLHLAQYKKKGYASEDFEHALSKETKASNIVTEATKNMNIRIAKKSSDDKQNETSKLIDLNKKFIIENQKNYNFEEAMKRMDLDPYFIVDGKTYNLNSSKFTDEVKALKWENYRKMKISGSGEKRSKPRNP